MSIGFKLNFQDEVGEVLYLMRYIDTAWPTTFEI